MADDDEIALICLPVGDMLPGDPQSTRGHYCKECNAEVWLSLIAVRWLATMAETEVPLICARCSIGMVDDMKTIEAVPGDEEGEAVINLMPQIIEELLRGDST